MERSPEAVTSETLLEEIIKELQRLAKLKPLKGEQQVEARQLMSELKRRSFTNAEISRLTKGLLDESTIKQMYTRGVVAVDSADKDRAIDLLAELSGRDLTLDDLEEFLPVKADLDDRGVAFDEVGSLIQMAKESDVQLEELVQLRNGLRESGLSIAELKEALAYRANLEEIGFTVGTLATIAEAAKTYGDPAQVMDAIRAYKSVAEVEEHLRKLDEEKEVLEASVGKLAEKVQQLTEQQKLVEDLLALVARLDELGFDEAVLTELAKSSTKYGGVKGVIGAVNAFTKLEDLKETIKDASGKKSKIETELKQVQADYAHMMEVIKLLEVLQFKLKFSIPAIKQFYKIARIYRNPMDLMDALGRFGQLSAIQGEIEERKASISKLEGRRQELSAIVESLQGQLDELGASISAAITPIGIEASKVVAKVRDEGMAFAETLGKLKMEANFLNQELVLARAILFTKQSPGEMKALPNDFGLLLIDGLQKFCRVKGMNPKAYPGDTLYQKYGLYKTIELELLDVLDWAERIFRAQLRPSQ